MSQKTACCYVSLRSPYSWIAFRQLAERFPDLAERLEYIPFWEPDAATAALLQELGGVSPYAPMSRAKHLYILQDIKRLVTKLGYPMVWPIDRDPWWDLPHLAYLAAQRQGRGWDYLDAAYRARWERGQDICSLPVIRGLADSLGMDAELLASAPDNPELRASGAAALMRAYRNGVFGVPFFTYGHEKFWGIDRLNDFAERLRA